MRKQTQESQKNHPVIPDIDIVDLEKGDEILPVDEEANEYLPDGEDPENDPGRKGFHFYMHIALLVVVLLVVSIVVYRLNHWGTLISQDDIFADGEGIYEAELLDSIFPAEDENGNILPPDHDGNGLTILALGNAPFADDAGSDDSLAAMIEDLTGGTIINCAVSGSYVASELSYLSPDDVPMDVYTPFWLCALALGSNIGFHYERAAEIMGDDFPPEGEYVYETLSNIDLNNIDVITFMYDATDYLMNHPMYNDEDPTNIQQFTGNFEAALSLLQSNYPHLRIIILSPTYAFAVDDDGKYISSDVKRYDYDVLSTYCIRLCYSCNVRRVTFVDNLYGTITEDNATEYLTDNLHLNAAGRRLVAERFLDALTYYGT